MSLTKLLVRAMRRYGSTALVVCTSGERGDGKV